MMRLLLAALLVAAPPVVQAQHARASAPALPTHEEGGDCGPTDILLWTLGFVVVSTAFLYLSDTYCGTPDKPGRCAAPAAPRSPVLEGRAGDAELRVTAAPVGRRGVGPGGDARYHVEARDAVTGRPVPVGVLGERRATVRERELPAVLDALRAP